MNQEPGDGNGGDGLLRLLVFHLYMPGRSLAHGARALSRRVRESLGLRKPSEITDPSLEIPSTRWSTVGKSRGVRFRETDKADGNVNLAELAVLNALCRAHPPRATFEIGTFDGRTTLNLALNTEGEVHTLDLPSAQTSALKLAGSDRKYIDKPGSGARFTSEPNCRLSCVKRIHQHFGDSATFDFSPWHGAIGLVFVDGSHSHEYVLNDTEVALRLLGEGGGVVVWHDYGVWPDVAVGLRDVRHRNPGLSMVHVQGTSLVVAVIPKKR